MALPYPMYYMVPLSSSVITLRTNILYFVISPSGIGHLILSPHFDGYNFYANTIVLVVLNMVQTRNHSLPTSNRITEPLLITQIASFSYPCSVSLGAKEDREGHLSYPISPQMNPNMKKDKKKNINLCPILSLSLPNKHNTPPTAISISLDTPYLNISINPKNFLPTQPPPPNILLNKTPFTYYTTANTEALHYNSPHNVHPKYTSAGDQIFVVLQVNHGLSRGKTFQNSRPPPPPVHTNLIGNNQGGTITNASSFPKEGYPAPILLPIPTLLGNE